MKYLKYLAGLTFLALLIVNIHIFVSTIQLSEDVTELEQSIVSLRKENISLESKLFSVDSHTYAASVAATYDFTKSSQPLYIDNPQYALNKGL